MQPGGVLAARLRLLGGEELGESRKGAVQAVSVVFDWLAWLQLVAVSHLGDPPVQMLVFIDPFWAMREVWNEKRDLSLLRR